MRVVDVRRSRRPEQRGFVLLGVILVVAVIVATVTLSLEQSTSDHGWNLQAEEARLRPLIAQLKSYGCRVSLFLDPDPLQVPLAREFGADRIELYTAPFAEAFEHGPLGPTLENYRATAQAAVAAGLEVNAGHDLSLDNLPVLIRQVPSVAEVSIGHALIAEALEFGLAETVRRYLYILRRM